MKDSEDPFVITVNLSKVFNDKKETKFSMLIDYQKMTIVYEVIEQIRWMFSLTGCLFLAHEDSIIHELEDIKILAVLEKFEIKPCPGGGCHHEKLYTNILNEIDFYTSWHHKKVPKFFAKNLDLIKDKLCLKSPTDTRAKELPDRSLSPTDVFNKKANPLELMEACSNACTNVLPKNQNISSKWQVTGCKETTSPNSPELNPKNVDAKETQNNIPSAMSNSVNKFESMCSPFVKNISGAKLTKSNTKPPSKVNSSSEMETQDSSLIAKTNPNLSDNVGKRNVSFNVVQTKRRNYIKPFSLGEVVAILRNDTQKGSCRSMEYEKSSNDIAKYEEETESVKRKRKRTRKNKVKKKSLPQMEDQLLSSPFIPSDLNFKPVENKKSSHIRFNSNSEDDEDSAHESNIFSTPTENNCVKDTYTKQYRVTSPNNTNQVPKLLNMEEEKKQVCSTPVNSDQLMDCTPTFHSKPIQREEDLIFLGSQLSNELQDGTNGSKSPSQSAPTTMENEFSLLKHKVPFPMIFERFC